MLPRSSKNALAGLHDDALKIKITAAPVKGAANKMCIQFLAKSLNLPKSALEIVSGHTGRNKKILIKDTSLSMADLQRILNPR